MTLVLVAERGQGLSYPGYMEKREYGMMTEETFFRTEYIIGQKYYAHDVCG